MTTLSSIPGCCSTRQDQTRQDKTSCDEAKQLEQRLDWECFESTCEKSKFQKKFILYDIERYILLLPIYNIIIHLLTFSTPQGNNFAANP